jgi:hypothetical protein
MKRFIINDWQAETYRTKEEIEKAAADFGVLGKKLKSVQPIGEVHINIDYPISRHQYYDWKLKLTEPLVFTFEDESTFEVMPTADGALRMGVNSVPAGTVNGFSDSNFNAKSLLFGPCTKIFGKISLTKISNTNPLYSFHFGKFRVSLNFREGYYTLSLFRDNKYFDLSGDYIIESFAVSGYDRIDIIPGWNGGGNHNFRIVSAEREKAVGAYPVAAESLRDCFDIVEEDTADFLYPFLQKHLDEAVQRELTRGEIYDFEGFEYYGWNYYTFEQVRAMFTDFRETAELIKKSTNLIGKTANFIKKSDLNTSFIFGQE